MQICLSTALQIVTALATTFIAGFVAVISRRQWQINRDKLKLDLFNRRFDIYLRVLDYYQELLNWQQKDDQRALAMPFIKSVRESRFIFPHESGVFPYLEEFQRHAADFTNFESLKEARKEMTLQERRASEQKHLFNFQWIQGAIVPLEEKMAPYLSFDNL